MEVNGLLIFNCVIEFLHPIIFHCNLNYLPSYLLEDNPGLENQAPPHEVNLFDPIGRGISMSLL